MYPFSMMLYAICILFESLSKQSFEAGLIKFTRFKAGFLKSLTMQFFFKEKDNLITQTGDLMNLNAHCTSHASGNLYSVVIL